jgi:GNAT superfamily N-acetyltransferase
MEISSVPQSAFDSCLEVQRQLDEALASRVEPSRWGTQLYRGDFIRVTDLNVLVVHADAGDVDAPTLIEEAERLQPFLPHRAVRVDDAEAGARLAPEFAGRGWVVSRTTLMVLRRHPDRPMDTSGVSEVDVERLQVARSSAIRNVHRDLEVAAQATQVGALQHLYAPLRAYAALVGNEVAAYCLLRIRDDGAKLVEVEALARSQGHGVGREVIWKAAATARREKANPIFVECEPSGWATTAYRRLGFDEAGTVHRFVRPW